MYPLMCYLSLQFHILPKGKYIESCKFSSHNYKLIAAYALHN
jgi:hypothetical protein